MSEPLDPNIPHPDIPAGILEQVEICELVAPAWIGGYAAGYTVAAGELAALSAEAADIALGAHMQTLFDDPDFKPAVHVLVHQLIDEIARQILANGGD